MDMENGTDLPLSEKVSHKNIVKNFFDIILVFFLLSLPVYRILSDNFQSHDSCCLLALICELWLTLYWAMIISTKWNPVDYKTYPERLLQWDSELPAVDMFVTTADAVLEPPIMTINTVLSLLAVDYPARKLACYVSDDGCSPIILYSLMEASKFAKLWIPFCTKHNLQDRAPFRYFSKNNDFSSSTTEFEQEWKNMKDEYEKLSLKIEAAAGKSIPLDLSRDFELFLNVQRNNHPTIIKVVWENKQGIADGLPHLVYISREKRPKHPHHYKAGAMNVLTRVSGLMANAPFMLNVDCDMFVNNPKVVLQAMCLLLGPHNEKQVAYSQFPQVFYDGLKDDPFGNQLIVLFEYMAKGVAGIQGPYYSGTGCFHRRKVIYGLSPDDIKVGGRHSNTNVDMDGKLAENQVFLKSFGNSKEFARAAANSLKVNNEEYSTESLEKSVEAVYEVAGCDYENGTAWGSKVGWVYGSMAEDVHTGLTIHKRGWKSVLCTPDPPAFMGCAPSSVPSSLTQQKRWATGLLEILFSKNCPIFLTLFGKLQLRQCLAYVWLLSWGLRPIPELCYSALPAYSIITNSHFLPKRGEPGFYIAMALFAVYNLYTISEYLATGQSIRAWWNNQRMQRIISMGPWMLGALSVVLKLLGISETVFEVTKKDRSTSSSGTSTDDVDDTNACRFTFDDSLVFVPLTTVLMVQLMALAVEVSGLKPPPHDGGSGGSGLLEVLCSVWLVLCLWPILKGLFGKGKYGIPLSTICKSTTLALLFVCLCIQGRRY